METTSEFVKMKEDNGNLVFYRPTDGEILVTIDGRNRKIALPSGSALEIVGHAVAAGAKALHCEDAEANYVSPELDTEAEIIVAINATNAKINAILASLEAFGINASA